MAYSAFIGTPRAAKDDRVLRFLAFWIVMGAALYQLVLCFVHTHLFPMRTSIVALSEFVLYTGCLYVLARRVQLEFIAVMALVAAYLFFMALMRGSLDFKGFRDILIIILFYWLGRTMGSMEMADRILKVVITLVLIFGFFELFFVNQYSRVFNVFSYYVNQGGLSGATNWAGGSLALNGMRPEGIGRTILPSLLGNHRISSIFLEPVSLGNFAVIVAGWGLSKPREEWRQMLFFLAMSAIMITLADSRYGLLTVMCLVIMRLIFAGRMHNLAILLPAICMALLLGIAQFLNGDHSDNVLGRLYLTGATLMHFGPKEIFGLSGYNFNFGDMGYAVVLTRFGLLFFAACWIGFWLIRMQDDRGVRFRSYVALYASLILSVSGTSLFALKTAGVLWFLVGCCALRQRQHTAEEAVPSTPARETLPRRRQRKVSYAH
ncbi:MAG TPA: polysaccharide polymerase [Oxalicibacterium sp.]|nr:polysaccharide polymerase [Oxalicibacterium sp.]